jgi:hypothetical protein
LYRRSWQPWRGLFVNAARYHSARGRDRRGSVLAGDTEIPWRQRGGCDPYANKVTFVHEP